MITAITQGELAALIPFLQDGKMREWCELSSAGNPKQVVYADSEMLSRCRVAAAHERESSSANNPNPEQESTPKDENVHGQRGADMDDTTDTGQSQNAKRKTWS